jgi:hypothetical protein
MRLIPKNWRAFQHYGNRRPPWIKLHRELLDDREFMNLPMASKAIAPLLWLLASESDDGSFDAAIEELAFRLRLASKEVESGLKPLIDKGFFVDASTMLAPCLQLARPETEKEVEKETKKKSKKFVVSVSKPDDVNETVWSDWLRHRESKDAGVTETVIKRIRNESSKIGMTLDAAMEMMCVRNWIGFEAEWVKKPVTNENFMGRKVL